MARIGACPCLPLNRDQSQVSPTLFALPWSLLKDRPKKELGAVVTGLTYLMTSLTVGLLVMIARGQQHETRDGVDIYTYPVALTRAIAILGPLIGLLGVFVWQRGPTRPTETLSVMIIVGFGGGMLAFLFAYWYFSSLRIEVAEQTLTVRNCLHTRIIYFKDVVDTNLIDGRSMRGGNYQLVVYLRDGGKLRFYDTITDFDDLSELVSYRMAGPPAGQEATAAKLRDISDRTRNKRREAWVLWIGIAIVALAVIAAKFA
jgi:hypothetical protein